MCGAVCGSRPLATVALLAALLGVMTACASVDPATLAGEYYRIANLYYDIGRYDEAIPLYQQALDYEAGLAPAEYNLIRAYIEQGNVSPALERLDRLIEQDPENLRLLETRAYANYRAGNIETALEQYRDVIGRSEYHGAALYNTALILQEQANSEEALEIIQRAYELDRTDVAAAFLYAELLSADEGGGDEAGEESAEEGEEESESDGEAGEESTDEGEEADEESSEEENKDDKLADIYASIATAEDISVAQLMTIAAFYERIDRFGDALETYDRVLMEDQMYAEARFGRAKILLTAAQDPVTGLQELERAFDDGFNNGDLVGRFLEENELLQEERIKRLAEVYEISIPDLTASPPDDAAVDATAAGETETLDAASDSTAAAAEATDRPQTASDRARGAGTAETTDRPQSASDRARGAGTAQSRGAPQSGATPRPPEALPTPPPDPSNPPADSSDNAR